ncbi:MAG: hypothetical protein AAB353_09570 [Candidatus Hydrogenedentota bacterium]
MTTRVAIRFAASLTLALAFAPRAECAETDQFLTWDIELEDCSGPLNNYFNREIEVVLHKLNERKKPVTDPVEVIEAIYLHVFEGLHSSRVREFLNTSPDIDVYPPRDVAMDEYRKMSIYNRPLFPYIFPMARTVRVGDVYCGIDKIGHFFGFGRRYFWRYARVRAQGMEDVEAAEHLLRVGMQQELSLVGMLVDGILSYGDLEANYMGFELAKDLVHESDAFVQRDGNGWRLVQAVDLRDYVTPNFDESYNVSRYWARRKKFVLPRLAELYCDRAETAIVRARFARYGEHRPSFFMDWLEEYLDARGRDPREEQALEVLCDGQRDTELAALDSQAQGQRVE